MILIVFSLSSRNPIFSHQRRIAIVLSNLFYRVDVITLESDIKDSHKLPRNLFIHPVRWSSKDCNAVKSVGLVKIFLKVLFMFDTKDTIIFSHMTDFACALISPISRLLKVPHVLWYAHTNYSLFLRISSVFVDRIITSTEGSCPYKGHKLSVIGQMVDEAHFQSNAIDSRKIHRTILYVGRLDPSKRIDLIIESFLATFGRNIETKLYLIGSPTFGNERYVDNLKFRFAKHILSGKIIFLGSLSSKDVMAWMKMSDVLLHAYQGSLDKVLVEAALMQLPILSINSEFNRVFGDLHLFGDQEVLTSLSRQCQFFLTLSSSEISRATRQRRDIALANHSLTVWVSKLSDILAKL